MAKGYPARGLRLGLLAGLVLAGCNPFGELELELEPIVLDPAVDLRLEAVSSNGGLFVVASGGQVIAHGRGASDLAHPLHGIHDLSCGDRGYVVVVGDEGYVALSDDLPGSGELEFEVLPTPTQADLWAVLGYCTYFGAELIVVGDETLLVGELDEQGSLEWSEPEPPVGGWGRLRDIGDSLNWPSDICAVGEAGQMVCSVNGETWTDIELDTKADLNALCPGYGPAVVAVGDAGTMVWSYPGEWTVEQLEPAVDLIACTTSYSYPMYVGADRTVYVDENYDGRLEAHLELDWQPRANDEDSGLILVGDRGQVGQIDVVSGLIPH